MHWLINYDPDVDLEEVERLLVWVDRLSPGILPRLLLLGQRPRAALGRPRPPRTRRP
jgi:hypothetical protein